ncbi:MAG: mechanosensitive ion channel family protein [Hahellaceae bacterium]|nr:mechanosensitive ion channel family protein [Hahellaceae bacterium]MCP5210389.1 mechanosensitive ion channel family protein [Hahellaceae bacterium]
MPEMLSNTYYNNTVLEWLTAMGIVLGVVLIARVVYRIFKTVFRKLTASTNTRLDDILVDMVEEPLVAMIVIAGIWLATQGLTLPDGLSTLIGHVMQFGIFMMVAWLLSRLIDSLFEEYLVPLTKSSENTLDDQLLPFLRKGLKMIIWCMAIIVGLNNAGYDVAALIAGLGIGGLALAMAAKDTVANIFGGFTILTDKPFSINDRVQVDGYDGTVTEIGIRSTRIKTLAGRIVTIPNSKFADSAVENVSWEPARKVTLELGLTYDTPPEDMEKGLQILQEIANEDEGVNEGSIIFFSGFGDFSMNITFIYYINKSSNIAATQNRVNLAVLKRFNAAGLEFAFPTQTLYNINATPKAQ